jgi:hypothetical protein
VNESHTAVLERRTPVHGPYATEPYEAAWANEAVFFVRADPAPESDDGGSGAHTARVQISPDGMQWCDEGSAAPVRPGELAAVKVAHFGGWLRIAGDPGEKTEILLSVHLVLKG